MVLTALATTIVLSLAAQGVPSGAAAAAIQAPGVATSAVNGSTRSANFPTFGDTGDDVVRLQQAMVARGFTLKGGIDGQFSARTQATLRNMQRAVGLKATGTVDERTARFLGLITVSRLTPETLPKVGDNGEAVWTVQQALINSGVTVKGGADGAFGVATTVALTTYQSRKGLRVTKTLDHATAFALGLVDDAPPVLVATPAATPTATKTPAVANANTAVVAAQPTAQPTSLTQLDVNALPS
ncbi:MAG: peptidoglycan-binding protein, partial [Ilumatobacteraceae bacterium]